MAFRSDRSTSLDGVSTYQLGFFQSSVALDVIRVTIPVSAKPYWVFFMLLIIISLESYEVVLPLDM